MTKKNLLSSRLFLTPFALIIFGLAGCTDMEAEAPDLPIITSPSYPQLAPIAPPLDRLEEAPVLDSPTTTLWRPGYWSYNGSTFDWVHGEVMPKPAPTAAWFPAYWDKHTYGWGFVPGHWQ